MYMSRAKHIGDEICLLHKKTNAIGIMKEINIIVNDFKFELSKTGGFCFISLTFSVKLIYLNFK